MPGKGSVEKIMQMCTGRGFSIQELTVERATEPAESEVRAIHLQLSGRRGVESLVIGIGDIKGVVSASLSASQQAKE
jgi:acetolactate synthase regulatory subunit